ncbi:unnamed protein product [Cylicocyclus nassatus]|uniref:non-specific serine/threonine protein kinase n=1 Tax=Cylicocyclus nassatus TaxID=53992 RepID=A0AA36HB29_CYLNA|nr:unnamed protein product [Cylicocyclus nassatus]
MPPKKIPKSKLHPLAAELPLKTILLDTTNKKQYCVGKQFATGGFGRIYLCNEVGSKKELVVKVEPFGNGPLFTEVNVFLRILKPEQIADFMKTRKLKRLGVPPLISSGIYMHGNDKLRFLVMPKYVTSLEAIREKSKTLSAANVWTVARCMLESLEYIHEKNYVHADIKAANILLERANDFSTSVLVDYGLARMSSSNEDKPDKKRAHNGTAIFTSCDAHRGCQPSYRGDLEILAYNLLYWLNGTLPWESFEAAPEKVYEMKKNFLKDLSSNLRKALQDNTESIPPLQEIFNAASKTGYDQQLSFPKLYKIVDDALKRVSKSGQKRTAAEENAETKKHKADRGKEAKNREIRRSEREEREDDSGDSAGDATEQYPQTKRNVRTRKRDLEKNDEDVESATTSNGGAKAKVRKIRKEPEHGGDSIAKDVEEKQQTKSPISKRAIVISSPTLVVAEQRKRKYTRTTNAERNAEAISLPSGSPASPRQRPIPTKRRRVLCTNDRLPSRRSPRLPSVQIIPGVTVTRSPILSPIANSTRKSNEFTVTPRGSNGLKAKNVSSEEKRSPTKLSKIPGMRNFQHGQGPVVIKQITKKYQRIAQQKRASQLNGHV